MAHAHNPNTCEVEVKGLKVQSHLQLHSKFQCSLYFIKPCLQTIAIKTKMQTKNGLNISRNVTIYTSF